MVGRKNVRRVAVAAEATPIAAAKVVEPTPVAASIPLPAQAASSPFARPAKRRSMTGGARAGVAGVFDLNVKQAKKRLSKAKEGSLKMRKHLWPEVENSALWLREDLTKKGYTTMPRTMPLLINLIGDISKHVTDGKSVPAGKAYLVLWCRVFDEGFLKIDTEAVAAQEAGYTGERNVTTWREHLRVLKELGFIDAKEGATGPYQYILIFNPYLVVKALRKKGWVQQASYTALFERAAEIGATDLDEN